MNLSPARYDPSGSLVTQRTAAAGEAMDNFVWTRIFWCISMGVESLTQRPDLLPLMAIASTIVSPILAMHGIAWE